MDSKVKFARKMTIISFIYQNLLEKNAMQEADRPYSEFFDRQETDD
jgi:hypothetical protein